MREGCQWAWSLGRIAFVVWFLFNVLSAQSKPFLNVSPTSLSFNLQAGGPPIPNPTLNVTSSGAPVTVRVSVTTASGGDWLSVGPAVAVTPTSLLIGLNPSGTLPGSYTGSIILTADGASNSTIIVPVTLNLTAGVPQLNVNPSGLEFTFEAGSNPPPPQSVSITVYGGANRIYTISATPGNWLAIETSVGMTPATMNVSVNPAGLGPGTYNGTITVTTAGASNSPQMVNVSLNITNPGPTIKSVVNGASLVTGAIAPGEIITIWGSGIGSAAPIPLIFSSDRMDTNLAATRVLFDEAAAPLIYVSSTQVNAVVPYKLAGKSSTRLSVEVRGTKSPGYDLQLADAAPGVFTTNGRGSGAGAILNQDLSLNSATNPASKRSVVVIYATGAGQMNPASEDDLVVIGALQMPVQPVSVSIGGRMADVLYAGSAPGMVAGVIQVNARVPDDISGGSAVPVVLTIGPASSQRGVTLVVQN